ncbi:holo-[acyl-carrier-protein] synthase [Phytophthora boehmeriae]|uniref:Holo-[acyl-carrier-protein] synthase n=1 Tax=Phytophthora boehmeriae TaxID=109152 RepID=A0A8T1WYV9_9STRA|nr:holo-[acyl-carrier-protein] synthase [Phytophthora boehmeriae]
MKLHFSLLLLAATASASDLPVFSFHGTSGSAYNSINFNKNLTAEGRAFVALEFCTKTCSTTHGLYEQTQMGVAKVREIIANNSELYQDGYIFIGHSQGGSIAKFVIEEMDDHNVKTFISLAGSSNGRFYGPQQEDVKPLSWYWSTFAAQIPSYVLNASTYADNSSTWNGVFQRDLMEAVLAYPELQSTIPQFNQLRSPYEEPWIEVNTAFPRYNNLLNCSTMGEDEEACVTNQTRYKNNFMRVENVHLFVSPNDSLQAPYQTGIYGSYSTVDSYDAIENEFQSLKVLDMTETREYLEDTYGLKTMNENGQLHRHSVPDVSHNCWIGDVTEFGDFGGFPCTWQPVYDEFIYPLL